MYLRIFSWVTEHLTTHSTIQVLVCDGVLSTKEYLKLTRKRLSKGDCKFEL